MTRILRLLQSSRHLRAQAAGSLLGWILYGRKTQADLVDCMAYIDRAIRVADCLGRRDGEHLAEFLHRLALRIPPVGTVH